MRGYSFAARDSRPSPAHGSRFPSCERGVRSRAAPARPCRAALRPVSDCPRNRPRRHGHRLSGRKGQARGRPAVTPSPPGSRARAWSFDGVARALRRPRPRLAGPAHARWPRALARLQKERWHGRRAQALLLIEAAPPVKPRFESSLARRFVPLSIAGANAPNAQSAAASRERPGGHGRPPDSCARSSWPVRWHQSATELPTPTSQLHFMMAI